MARPQTIQIKWNWISCKPGFTWADDVKRQLEDYGLTEHDLKTCVYVIVADGRFAIDYPNRVSPTLYIGSGDFKSRLVQHQRWLDEINELVQDYRFSVAVCQPKTKLGEPAHKELEADLLQEFYKLCGCIPIRNKRFENATRKFNYAPQTEFTKPLIIGRGYRYHWAIKPLKSNRYYRSFTKKIA